MHHHVPIMLAALALSACAGQKPTPVTAAPAEEPVSHSAPESSPASTEAPAPADDADTPKEFAVQDSDGSAKNAHGVKPSRIKASKTEAALKFIVVDKETGPIPGIVISVTAPDGAKYFTEETDAVGYAEVLVPVGKKYNVVYLSLGHREIAATLPVSSKPNQNIRLTLRYKGYTPPEPDGPGIVLNGVTFENGKADLTPESFPQFENIVEYMTHKKSVRIEISGHTDNAGNAKSNQKLSERRAQACRDYLVSRGIDKSRIDAVGYGDAQPIASNNTEEGRRQNRRIEASEL